MKFTRDFYQPKTYERIRTEDDLGIEVHADRTGAIVMAFAGKRQKPDFHIRFGSQERANRYVADWIERLRAELVRKQERKAERKAFRHSLKIGDVLRSCWGYDQTNVEHYEITALIGAHMVEVREIDDERVETAFMQGKCTPLPGQYVGEPMRRRVTQGNVVKISTCIRAWKIEPKATVGTVKIYEASHWTAYA